MFVKPCLGWIGIGVPVRGRLRDFAALKDDIAEAARAAHRKLDVQSTQDKV